MKKPEDVLTDWREDAQVLRGRGHTRDAEALERCAEEIAASLAPFITWVSEPDAMLRSGRAVDFFRSRFGSWHSQGLAEMRGRTRYYRAAVIPLRAHPSVARLAGLRGERAG